MPTTNDVMPLLNGEEVSYADLQISFLPPDGNAIKEFGIHEFNSSEDSEIGEVRGTTGGRVVARTTGNMKLEASMIMSRRGAQNFIRQLSKNAPTRNGRKLYGRVPFDVVQFSTPLGSDEIYEKRILGCRIAGNKLALKEGNEHDKVELKLHPMDIVEIVDGEEVSLG
jgi:hypothetical protein